MLPKTFRDLKHGVLLTYGNIATFYDWAEWMGAAHLDPRPRGEMIHSMGQRDSALQAEYQSTD